MASPNLVLDIPQKASKLVLHACCAPCSGAIIECMLENGLQPTIFYFNPNIFPENEYERRKAENIRLAESLHVSFIDGDYQHSAWKKQMIGMETEPERGKRCLACFKMRLIATAKFTSDNGFTIFTTTLASSRWKDLAQINESGRYAATLFPNLLFWEQNWRKGGLSIRRNELVKQYAFYNQTYCGCEFSICSGKF